MGKNKILIFAVGIIGGIFVTFIVLGAAYVSSIDKSEILNYYLEHFRGVDNVRDDAAKVAEESENTELSAKDTVENRLIKISIDPKKEVRKVSPLIYGSNLGPKMQSEEYIKKFVKHVGLTAFRFPGGGSPGYRWKLGKCDFSDRTNEAPLSEINNVIDFCRDTGAELILQVNIESGTPQEAADWVDYMNKKKGFKVTYWELGNEAYGDWDKAYMSGKKYAGLVKDYAVAMKAVNSSIKIGANWGGAKYDKFDRELIKGAADYIDFVSYHWYPNHVNKDHIWKGKAHPDPADVIGNTPHIALAVERLNKLVKEYAPHREGKIEMTFLEWDGSWDAPASDPSPYEQNVIMWSLANAIFYADTLGQFATHGVTVSAHYEMQGIMFGLIRGWDKKAGWGGEPWDDKTIRPKAYAIKLFSEHFGDILLETECKNILEYYKENDWWNGSYAGAVPYVSCYASKHSEDGKLGIILINKHPHKHFAVEIDLGDFNPRNEGSIWVLNGPSLVSQNDGFPDKIRITQYKTDKLKAKFTYSIPPHSVSAFEVEEAGDEIGLGRMPRHSLGLFVLGRFVGRHREAGLLAITIER